MLKQGDKYIHEFVITQDEVNAFAEISGDKNPIHVDVEYAKTTPFGRPIVHGILSAAVFSKVFGTLFPGEGTIYMSQELKFLAPVFTGDSYLAKFEIIETDGEKHRGVIKCTIESMEGKVVLDGQAKLQNKNKF